MSITVTFVDNKKQYETTRAMLRDLKAAYVKVGFPEGRAVGQPTKQGSRHEPVENMQEMAYIAAQHEFGCEDRGIPERRFIRPAIDKHVDTIVKLKEKLLEELFDGGISIYKALDNVGDIVEKFMKREIDTMVYPPLKQSTVDKKGSEKLLIDTKQMYNSIKSKVFENG